MTSSDSSRLQRSIAALRTELDSASGLDPAAAARLRATLAEIESTLAETPLGAGGESGLGHRLAVAAREFDDSHPALSATLAGVIETLSRIGI
jgi:hypothetical protein